MKAYILSAVIIISFNSFAQKFGTVTYKINPIQLGTNNTPSADPLANQVKAIAESQEFTLTFNDSVSKFEQKNIISSYDENLIRLASITFTTEDIFYFNLKTDVQVIKKIDGTLIEIEENSKWTITTENKKIADFQCYKATRPNFIIDRNGKAKTLLIIAWFAPSLPYSFGPKGYNGLPGLVLELTDRKTTYLATNISPDNLDELIIDFPKGKKITEKEYQSKLRQ